MLPNALATTLALALAIPGGVFAVDAVNDDTVPGVSTSEFFRERGAALGLGQGHDRHDQAHAKHHPGAHDRAHGNHTDDTNGTHDRRGPHQGTDHASYRGHPGAHPGAQLVARCLTNEDNTTQDCIDLAGRIANVTVDRVAECLESEEPRRCYGNDGRHQAHFVGRIAHCIDDNGQAYCADKLATHLVCQGARIAGVESPVDCPAHDHPYPEKQQTTADSEDSDDADTTTSSDGA